MKRLNPNWYKIRKAKNHRRVKQGPKWHLGVLDLPKPLKGPQARGALLDVKDGRFNRPVLIIDIRKIYFTSGKNCRIIITVR